MCGFVAIVSPLPIAAEDLDAMRDRLAHRGPDGARSWIGRTDSGYVGLGHRRLSIIDLSAEADQPMWSRDGKFALVYNGEVYNYVELRAELEGLGATFATQSDTEVLLQAYATWGHQCLPRLNGMFAFAIWDAFRGELFVARDRFGEKPLFYARLPGGGVAFASEMKALFAHPGVSARTNETSLAAYVAGVYDESGEATMFADVERVPAAHALVVSPEGEIARTFRFWTPDYAVRESDAGGAVDRFRELLAASVRMRLRSDVPVGTSLSGGLDSSTIVALLTTMRDVARVPTQKTFSSRFDHDPTLSEGEYVDSVVEATGVEAYAVTPTGDGLAAESRRLHWHQEEPFLSASIYLQWCVMRLAHEQGTTVLLDGQGADELLGGYQYYFPTYQLDLLSRGRLRTLVRDTRRFRSRLAAASRRYGDSTRRFDHRAALGARALLARWLRSVLAAEAESPPGVPPAARGMRLRHQRATALQYDSLPVLLRYADRNAMAFSREARFPFLDHVLVDWCVGLPEAELVADGWQKAVLRRAAAGLLPDEIVWRADKVGYAAPLDVWLRGSMRLWAEERLFASDVRDVEGYDSVAIRRLWEEHQAGARNHSWALWRWISLAEWLQLGAEGVWKSGIDSRSPTAARVAG